MTQYDLMLEPPEEQPRYWLCEVEVAYIYTKRFYGTREEAEQAAYDYFNNNTCDECEKIITVDSYMED
jgi:hypothetical protein